MYYVLVLFLVPSSTPKGLVRSKYPAQSLINGGVSSVPSPKNTPYIPVRG